MACIIWVYSIKGKNKINVKVSFELIQNYDTDKLVYGLFRSRYAICRRQANSLGAIYCCVIILKLKAKRRNRTRFVLCDSPSVTEITEDLFPSDEFSFFLFFSINVREIITVKVNWTRHLQPTDVTRYYYNVIESQLTPLPKTVMNIKKYILYKIFNENCSIFKMKLSHFCQKLRIIFYRPQQNLCPILDRSLVNIVTLFTT